MWQYMVGQEYDKSLSKAIIRGDLGILKSSGGAFTAFSVLLHKMGYYQLHL